MIINVLRISNDILLGKKQDDIIQYVLKSTLEAGEVVTQIITTENHPERILSSLNNANADLTIIIGEEISSKNFNIKKTLGSFLNKGIIKSEFAINAVNSYYQKTNTPVLYDSENEYYLLESSELLPVFSSALQAYLIADSNNKMYVFIPGELSVVQEVFNNFLLSIIKNNNNIQYKTTTIKTFGISEKDIYVILSDLVKNKYKILILTYPNNLETSVVIRYNKNIEPSILNDFIAKVLERLNKYIYADEEVSIANRAYDLLQLSKKKLAIAETITGGNIASTMLKSCDLTENLIKESIVCFDDNSLVKRLNVTSSIIKQYGAVSVEVAYEMAAGLLEMSGADIVCITNGLINITEDKKGKLCFIAVGNSDGIHVYKNTVYGSKEQVVNSLTQTAFFYLIKNIKQNDLFFDKTTI